jgi:GT2 family glycosyltransferase
MIVDDGKLEPHVLAELRGRAEHARWQFRYLNKSDRPGLFRSRIAAVEASEADIILFLDDDVEVEPGYLAGLVDLYTSDPAISGVGGVDKLCPRTALWRRLYEHIILFRALSVGRLSFTGYGGSMDGWRLQQAPFRTDYFSGCNMSFVRRALLGLPDLHFLDGHATGEDLLLSRWARKTGELVVDPRLQVRHYQVPAARDSMERVFYRQVVNHYHLLVLARASVWRRLAILYTASGLLSISLAKYLWEFCTRRSSDSLPRVRGGLRGMNAVLSCLFHTSEGDEAARATK